MTRRQLTPGILIGLYFMHKYRFLTIGQFATITNLHVDYVAKVLRDYQRWGLVGYFGFTSIPGHGKTPKIYFLKRKGWEVLCIECDEEEYQKLLERNRERYVADKRKSKLVVMQTEGTDYEDDTSLKYHHRRRMKV